MKRLWKVISREMRKTGLNAKKMARKLRMDPAHLSRLRTGQLRDLSAETLGHLVDGLGTSDAMRSELLVAYIHDKLKGNRSIVWKPAEEAIHEMVIREDASAYENEISLSVSDASLRAGLNRRVAGALEILATEARGSRRLQAILISLADFAQKNEPNEVAPTREDDSA